MKKVLVIVDMQNDFVTGSLANIEAQKIIPNVIAKIKKHKEEGSQIIFTQDTHFSNTYPISHEGKYLPVSHCIMNSAGWEIIPEIKAEFTDNYPYTTFLKTAFGSDELAKSVARDNKEDKEIEIIGICTDICVISNALMMRSQVFADDIIVDASCCAGTTIENHHNALNAMKCCQIKVINEFEEK